MPMLCDAEPNRTGPQVHPSLCLQLEQKPTDSYSVSIQFSAILYIYQPSVPFLRVVDAKITR